VVGEQPLVELAAHKVVMAASPSTAFASWPWASLLALMLGIMERGVPRTDAPLVVTCDPVLRELLLRLCAAAAVTPELVGEAVEARTGWRRAPCVVVGDDLAGEVALLGLPKRSDVVLVASGPESAATWQRGVALHADHVALLPEAESWLVTKLSESLDSSTSTCLTLGVVGARGGAGASTLAAALGLAASRRGQKVLLVDADPLSGGVDLVVGCEDVDGLRWPQVASTHGRVGAAALRAALPRVGELAVLSWDRGGGTSLDVATVNSILASGRRGSELILIDLPRHLGDAAHAALTGCDVVVVVCTGQVSCAAAAVQLLRTLRPECADIRLVVRQRAGASVDAEALSETLELSLLQTIPTKRSVERSIEEGVGPPPRGPLQQRCVSILERVGQAAAPR
jgi:secretion/DNA translocation related CpaE-like protein